MAEINCSNDRIGKPVKPGTPGSQGNLIYRDNRADGGKPTKELLALIESEPDSPTGLEAQAELKKRQEHAFVLAEAGIMPNGNIKNTLDEMGRRAISEQIAAAKDVAPNFGPNTTRNGNLKRDLGKVRYIHDAIIDAIIANPIVSQKELAQSFQLSETYVSMIIQADAFQIRLAERKAVLTDPVLAASMEERFKALASRSMDVIMNNLETTNDVRVALKGLELTGKYLGYGAPSAGQQPNGPVQNNTFVVAMPSQAPSAESWEAAHKPKDSQAFSSQVTADPNALSHNAVVRRFANGESLGVKPLDTKVLDMPELKVPPPGPALSRATGINPVKTSFAVIPESGQDTVG